MRNNACGRSDDVLHGRLLSIFDPQKTGESRYIEILLICIAEK
jgi:hypothetical protein